MGALKPTEQTRGPHLGRPSRSRDAAQAALFGLLPRAEPSACQVHPPGRRPLG